MHWHVTPRLFEIEWVQVKMEMAVAPGMVAPLDGTPDDQGVNGTSEGGKKNKSGGPRRKVGRERGGDQHPHHAHQPGHSLARVKFS